MESKIIKLIRRKWGVALLAFGLCACQKSNFNFVYSSSLTPQAAISLGASQAAYTQNRNINFNLSSDNASEMTFFVNTPCSYRQAVTWETYQSQKQITLPNIDGVYTVAVMFRTSDHFPSECQSTQVVLDRQGPGAPSSVTLASRTSTTVASPSFSFGVASDLLSPIHSYQARILKASDSSEVLGWTDAAVLPGLQTSLTTVLVAGTGYVVEVRAQDEAQNYGAVIRSDIFYAGLQMSLSYIDSSSATQDCSSSVCYMTTGVYKFQVSLNFAAPENLTLHYETEDITALTGYDYYSASGTLSIPMGTTSASFLLNIHDSPQVGPNRSFNVHFNSNISPTNTTAIVKVRSRDGAEALPAATQPDFLNFTLGGYSACGLSTDNHVYCWGYRTVGGADVYPSLGFRVPGLDSDTITQLQSSYGGGCALTSTGLIKCWNFFNMSPYENLHDDQIHTLTGFTNVQQFSLSRGNNLTNICAVLTNGTIRCAGPNTDYILGSGSAAASSTAVNVSGFTNVGVDPVATKVSIGFNFACALTSTGAVYCWGQNDFGQLGINTTTTYSLVPALVNGLPTMKDIGVGGNHACGVSNDDRLFCWGNNEYSKIGLSAATPLSYTPVEITGQTGIQSLAISEELNCMIRRISAVDKVFCWGRNYIGSMGLPRWGIYSTPQEMTAFPGTPVNLAASDYGLGMCGVNSQHQIYCWGGSYGYDSSETGIPYNDDYTFNNKIPSNSRFITDNQDIAGNNFTLCTKDSTGHYYCRGINTITDSMSVNDRYAIEPELLSPDPLLDVAFGRFGEFQCYVSQNKKVSCRGQNNLGQLGNGTTTDSATFVELNSPSNVRMISTGVNHVCALTEGSQVACWGYNNHAQIGTAPVNPYIISSPTLISGLPAGTIKKIVTGDYNNCVLYDSGSVYCWGSGFYGQLGDGNNTANQPTPVQVSGVSNFNDISGGMISFCGVTATGSAYCWGLNTSGNLGDGTTSARNVPTLVSAPGIQFTSISTTEYGTCAISSTGEVYCWGWNGIGQLGNDTIINSNTPVKVKNIAGGAKKILSREFYNLTFTAGNWSNCVLIELAGQRQDIKCWGAIEHFLGTTRGARTTPQRLWIDQNSL